MPRFRDTAQRERVLWSSLLMGDIRRCGESEREWDATFWRELDESALCADARDAPARVTLSGDTASVRGRKRSRIVAHAACERTWCVTYSWSSYAVVVRAKYRSVPLFFGTNQVNKCVKRCRRMARRPPRGSRTSSARAVPPRLLKRSCPRRVARGELVAWGRVFGRGYILRRWRVQEKYTVRATHRHRVLSLSLGAGPAFSTLRGGRRSFARLALSAPTRASTLRPKTRLVCVCFFFLLSTMMGYRDRLAHAVGGGLARLAGAGGGVARRRAPRPRAQPLLRTHRPGRLARPIRRPFSFKGGQNQGSYRLDSTEERERTLSRKKGRRAVSRDETSGDTTRSTPLRYFQVGVVVRVAGVVPRCRGRRGRRAVGAVSRVAQSGVGRGRRRPLGGSRAAARFPASF